MNRSDVKASRDLAARYVEVCDELLATKIHLPGASTHGEDWAVSWMIGGKLSGAHRRLSLDLTRALAHMRRRQ